MMAPATNVVNIPVPSLKRRVLSGSFWTVIGFGATFVLRLASNIVLSRLLFPKALGLMQVVTVVITGLQMFSEIGVGAAVIQNARGDDPQFLGTAWTLQVIRGAVLWACTIALAPLVANWYQEPELSRLLAVAGFTCLLGGLNSVGIHTRSRHIDLRAVTLLDVGSVLTGALVMIAWALCSRSVWALLGGSFVGATVKAVGSHIVLPGPRLRLVWHTPSVRGLVGFGRWVFINTLVSFVAAQADRLITGRLVSIEALGIYGIAATLVQMLRAVIGSLAGSVLFPAVAKQSHLSREELRAKIGAHRWILLGLGGAAVAVLFIGGDRIVAVVYDARYHAAGWALSLLTLGLWPTILSATSDMSLWALGQTRAVALASTARLAALCVLVPLGFWKLGFAGMVLAVSLIDWVRYACSTVALRRERLSFFRQDAAFTVLLVVALAALLVLRRWLGLGLPVRGMWLPAGEGASQ